MSPITLLTLNNFVFKVVKNKMTDEERQDEVCREGKFVLYGNKNYIYY